MGARGQPAEDASDFVHSHSTRFVPAADSGKGAVESRVSLSTFFARPGPHRVWSQFQREGRVVTVSFTIPVAPLDRLARRANGLWSFPAEPEGSGLDGAARALASAGTDLYVGGDFRRVGELAASGIAKWDGRRWSALAGGVNGSVWAIAARGRYLYAGGDFTRAGGRPARGVARWDGRAWRELGGGVGGGRENAAASVYALALVGSDLYVGGDFSTAGGTAASGIARWDGQAWHAVEGGVRTGIYPGVVRAFAARGGDLYAGGEFRTAGNATAYNVARWDGASWSVSEKEFGATSSGSSRWASAGPTSTPAESSASREARAPRTSPGGTGKRGRRCPSSRATACGASP